MSVRRYIEGALQGCVNVVRNIERVCKLIPHFLTSHSFLTTHLAVKIVSGEFACGRYGLGKITEQLDHHGQVVLLTVPGLSLREVYVCMCMCV